MYDRSAVGSKTDDDLMSASDFHRPLSSWQSNDLDSFDELSLLLEVKSEQIGPFECRQKASHSKLVQGVFFGLAGANALPQESLSR